MRILVLLLSLVVHAESLRTPLTPEEEHALTLALVRAQGAKLTWLDHLISGKASLEDARANTQLSDVYLNLLKSLIAKHSACTDGGWDFDKKEWSCPEPKK